MTYSLAEIAIALRQAQRPVLTGHIMPDGDCIGSVLGLALILEELGQKPTLVSNDPIPLAYRFLPQIERFNIGTLPDGDYDTLIALDCSVPERVGDCLRPLMSRSDLRVINIDHHASAAPFGDYNYIDASAAAVGEIIYDLAPLLGIEMNQAIATCLYTAILTDTGCFRYDNTTADTHLRVAHLIKSGLSPAAISTAIYDEKPLSALVLLGRALQTLRISESRLYGKAAWMSISRIMQQEADAREDDSDGLINYARQIESVEVALLFREMADGCIKVTFRSKHKIDVSQLAHRFGGGGHPRAAGCSVYGSLSDVEAGILEAALTALDGGGNPDGRPS